MSVKDAAPSSAHPFCLIGGTGRSGTTLLRQIFAAHPQVASLASEARFLTDPDGIVDFVTSTSAGWSPYLYDVNVRRLERLLRDLGGGRLGRLVRRRPAAGRQKVGHQPRKGRSAMPARARSALRRLLPRYWAVDLAAACPSYVSLVDQLIDRLGEFRFQGRWMGMDPRSRSEIVFGGGGDDGVIEPLRDFCRAFAQCVCATQDATHLVEDTPFNLLAFETIHQLLPESRLVHIHRDPRDVVASYLERAWSPSDPVQAARFYAAVMARWESVRPRLPADSYLEVSLAGLVNRPEATIRDICAFWGLDWHASLLGVDLSRSNSGRWKTDIPASARAEVERVLGPYVERYGQPDG